MFGVSIDDGEREGLVGLISEDRTLQLYGVRTSRLWGPTGLMDMVHTAAFNRYEIALLALRLRGLLLRRRWCRGTRDRASYVSRDALATRAVGCLWRVVCFRCICMWGRASSGPRLTVFA